MAIPHDLTADLPPPRDDEPASLRRDIVDELADHLACALHREMLRGGIFDPGETASDSPDSSLRTAHNNVLARFGNPAAVAHRLWLDAMKEKLMAQKITILLASVATAAVVFLSVALWQTLERARDAQQLANESQLALIQQHEQFSAKILKTFESLRAAPAASTSVDGWSPMKVRLVADDGAPVQGKVRLVGTAINAGNDNRVSDSRTTGPDGVADFGMLPYGNYDMTVTVPAAQEEHQESFMLAPGRPSDREMVCPSEPRPPISLAFKFNPPDGIKAEDLVYAVHVKTQSHNLPSGPWFFDGTIDQWLLVDAEGTILGSDPTWQRERDSRRAGIGRETSESVYDLSQLVMPELRAYDCWLAAVSVYARVDSDEPLPGGVPSDKAIVGSDVEYAPRAEPIRFEAQGGGNVWDIAIPDEVWRQTMQNFRRSSLARHVATPEGMQITRIRVSISDLSRLPRRRQTSSRPFGGFEPADGTSVDIVFKPPISEQFSPDLDPAEHAPRTLVRTVELIDRADLRQFSFGQRRRGSERPTEGYVSLLLSDEQAEAVKLAAKKGKLGIAVTDDAGPPMLDQSVLDDLMQLPDTDDS